MQYILQTRATKIVSAAKVSNMLVSQKRGLSSLILCLMLWVSGTKFCNIPKVSKLVAIFTWKNTKKSLIKQIWKESIKKKLQLYP